MFMRKTHCKWTECWSWSQQHADTRDFVCNSNCEQSRWRGNMSVKQTSNRFSAQHTTTRYDVPMKHSGQRKRKSILMLMYGHINATQFAVFSDGLHWTNKPTDCLISLMYVLDVCKCVWYNITVVALPSELYIQLDKLITWITSQTRQFEGHQQHFGYGIIANFKLISSLKIEVN